MANTVIVGLWVPVVIIAHVIGILCLLLGPLKVLLRGQRARARAARRSSAAGKHSKDHSSDDEGEEGLSMATSPQQQQQPSCSPAPKGATIAEEGEHHVQEESKSQQSSLPGAVAERVRLEWQQICCSYEGAHGKVAVLQDIWGRAEPGEMQALLGPSGAGKSTLMDILAQRKSVGNLSGFLLVNGQPATSGYIRKTAYVPQDDNFVATMTTLETLSFYASIILPGTWTKADRRQRITEVLEALGLKHRHETVVGGTLPGGLLLRGLSGGERKRLSIAAGILATPSVIFLDEPTSGLDSFAALSVMGYLKRMAREKGHVIIASIHQPRSAIWGMFDKVTLVATGRLMFHGPRDDMVPWFGHLGYTYDPAQHGVASDWALDLVAIGFHKPVQLFGHSITNLEQLQGASCQFVSSYRTHSGSVLYRGGSESMMIGTKSLKHRVRARMQRYTGTQQLLKGQLEGSEPGLPIHVSTVCSSDSGASSGSNSTAQGPSSAGGSKDAVLADGKGIVEGLFQLQGGSSSQPDKWATGWWHQFSACFGRELLSVTRNPADVAGRILTFCWVGVLTGLLFYNLSAEAGSIQARLNLCFSNLAFLVLMPYIAMSLYTADKKFYLADASAKLYRPHAYYAAKVAATLPFHVAAALIFSFTVYGMAGLRPGPRYIWQNGCLNTLLSLISVQVMHGCAILAPNQDMAFMLSICWTAIQLLMSNFFITFNSVSNNWITQLRWISALYYAFEGVALTEFAGTTFRCDKGLDQSSITTLRRLLPNNRYLNMPVFVNALKNPGADCIATTDAVLDFFDYSRPFGTSFGILVGYLVLMHILTYLWMIIVARREQR